MFSRMFRAKKVRPTLLDKENRVPGAIVSRPSEYRSYPTRFVVLVLICLASALSAANWLALAPLTTIVTEHWKVDNMQINLLALSYEIIYLPASIFATWYTERNGLFHSMFLASVGNMLCCWLKYGGSVMDPSHASSWGLIMGGQWVAAAVQPLLLNIPSRIAIDFFPENERAFATVMGTMFNGVGQLVGSLVPPHVVQEASEIPRLLLGIAIASVVILVCTICFVRDRPPSAPSLAAATQWDIQDAQSQKSKSRDAVRAFVSNSLRMLRDWNFVLSALGFAFVVGVCWTTVTVQSQLIEPCDYDATVAGNSAAILLGVGILSAFIAEVCMRKSGAYNTFLKGFMLLALASLVFVLGANKPGNQTLIYIAWCALGVTLQPIIPVGLENAAEQTFPIPPDYSAGILFTFTNVAAMILTFAVTPLLERRESAECTHVVTPAAGLLAAFMAAGVVLSLPVRDNYRRRTAVEESKKMAQVPDNSIEEV